MATTVTTAILHALPEPVLLLDDQKVILAANSAAKDLLGGQIEGRSLAMALRQPEILDAVNDVLAGRLRPRFRIQLITSVRHSFDIQVASLSPAIEGEASVILVMHDMTAGQNAEQMRADFVANVSHELRSPLSSLIGFIETLRGPARDDEAARDKFLGIMDGEAKRMARLIDDLLSLSKVEANAHIPPEGKVDLNALLAEVRATLSARALDRNISIVQASNPNLAEAAGDRDELTEVFHNLIDNAIKYCPEGTSVTISIESADRIPDLGGAGIAVSISDEGEGIDPEHLPRLTERFYRVDKGRSREMGGTGLGLAIVKHIINRHRGRLTVNSTHGVGTVFRVYLPSKRQSSSQNTLS